MFASAKTVARKEVLEAVRDGRLRLLAIVVAVLGSAGLFFGAVHSHRAEAAREDAMADAAKQWRDQGQKNPHVAAHYGTHVFAPTNVATAIDPGVSVFLGRSIKLEAHKRSLAAHSAAQDGTSFNQLGAFSLASVLQLLVPLLIIVTGYGAWSRERESGTLRQLLSSGVERGPLLVGKVSAMLVLVLGLMVPTAAIIMAVLWGLGGGDSDTVTRLTALVGVYLAYYSFFAGLTLGVSALARSSRAALVGLIAAWGLLCLAWPRAAAEIAGVAAPMTSEGQLSRDIERSLAHGIDGATPREDAIEKRVALFMEKAGIAGSGMLVGGADIAGLELQAEAAYEDEVYDHHMRLVHEQLRSQERIVAWVGALSPYIAVRELSAGLCGTDLAHHWHFTEAAERWRKQLVGFLNEAFAKDGGAKGWSYKAGPELWKRVPSFEYEAPSADFALSHHQTELATLLAWLLISATFASVTALRVRVL